MKKTILFDENSSRWDPKNVRGNCVLVAIYECRLNDIFQIYGSLLLRDVYEALGLPVTRESLIAGWVKGESNEKFEFEVHSKPGHRIEIILPDMESDIQYAFPSEES